MLSDVHTGRLGGRIPFAELLLPCHFGSSNLRVCRDMFWAGRLCPCRLPGTVRPVLGGGFLDEGGLVLIIDLFCQLKSSVRFNEGLNINLMDVSLYFIARRRGAVLLVRQPSHRTLRQSRTQKSPESRRIVSRFCKCVLAESGFNFDGCRHVALRHGY